MSLVMRLDIVNDHEYRENEDYREIIVKIPADSIRLNDDFKYLGLDYNNLSLQDTNILSCTVIDLDSKSNEFTRSLTRELNRIIKIARESGKVTSFQDIECLFGIVNKLDIEDREKLLAILKLKEEKILNIKDVNNYAKQIDKFMLYGDVNSYEEYARRLIEDCEVDMYDVMDYVDLDSLGNDYCSNNNGLFTDYGLILEVENVHRRSEEEQEEFE